MANDSSSSIVVGIIAIVAVFAIAYFGFMFFNKAAVDNNNTPVIDVNLGTTGGTGGNPPPNYAQ